MESRSPSITKPRFVITVRCEATSGRRKRQLEKRRIRYEVLDNGFLSCAEPEKLQQICDALGPEVIDRVFRKWLSRLPLPLRVEDRAAGYDWSLSIWQMEVSLTQIFDSR